MKNIVIYSQKEKSDIQKILENEVNYSVKLQKPEDIKQIDSLQADLVIMDISENVTKDLLSRNKVSVPLVVISDQIIKDFPIRTEAYDYILTPIKEDELLLRVTNLLLIRQLREELRVVSTTDNLTGLYNRPYLHERLEAELSRSKRYNIPISCLLLDIDYFKVVNDIYGYDWGDVLLKDITEIIKNLARKEDILTRYGDEEFIIVLPSTDEDNAYIFAERLRKDIEKMDFKPEGEEERHPVTISGGIASYPFQIKVNENAQTIIRYAEHALYNAKKRGKNKIVQFSQINLEF